MTVNRIKELVINPIEVDCTELDVNSKYAKVKLNLKWYCELLGISKATFYRWCENYTDKRKGSNHPNLTKYSKEHEDKVIEYIKRYPDFSVDELIAFCLDSKDDNENPNGFYLGSRSYVYRLMHKVHLINANRSGKKGVKHNFNKNRLIATAPNQIYVWDITYLYKSVEGEYLYLYAIMDLYSRKMIHYEVHNKQSDSIAAKFLENALHKSNIAVIGHLSLKLNVNDDIIIKDKLILHSDNGAPMKGKNMLAKMSALGITASYSRPHHSNDNAHMESSFALLKNCHSMPIPKCFDNVSQAQLWVNKFYDWYNNEHLHSGINFITPTQCHAGLGDAIMANRNKIITKSNCVKKIPYKMPKKVSLMSFVIKRKSLERTIKNQEYRKAA